MEEDEEDDDDADDDDDDDDDQQRLWPSWGAREVWRETVQAASTVSDLGLALYVLRQAAAQFGVCEGESCPPSLSLYVRMRVRMRVGSAPLPLSLPRHVTHPPVSHSLSLQTTTGQRWALDVVVATVTPSFKPLRCRAHRLARPRSGRMRG